MPVPGADHPDRNLRVPPVLCPGLIQLASHSEQVDMEKSFGVLSNSSYSALESPR